MSNAQRAITIAQQIDGLITEIFWAEDMFEVFGLAQRAKEIIAELPERWEREILTERVDGAIDERMQQSEESP